jgi:hypothetical protein
MSGDDAKVYSPQQVAIATVLGAPLAGSFLLAQNFRVLGKRREQRWTLVCGLAATVVLLAIAFVLPEKFPKGLIPMLYTITLRQTAIQLQGNAIRPHLEAGHKQSWWRVIAIGVAGLAFFVAVFLVLILASLGGEA